MLIEWLPIIMFVMVCLVLMLGYPVALTLAGTALFFAGFGVLVDAFDPIFLQALPNRLYGIMINQTLIAVPLFVFMGVMLERSKVAENLLDTLALLLGSVRAGLGIAITLVGMLLAASTGIVGATVVTMGLLSLPSMLKHNYHPQVATGIICASGTLGQIIPPSIVLVLLGDVLSSAYQQAQLDMGIFSPETVSVGDLFVGAIIPGIMLVGLYMAYLLVLAIVRPSMVPSLPVAQQLPFSKLAWRLLTVLLPPVALIVAVLGSILMGVATPTEAASVGAIGAMLLAGIQKQLNPQQLKQVMQSTTKITSMVFLILIGASIFSLVFRGFGGDELVEDLLLDLPGGKYTAFLTVMLLMFFLGFVLDFIEITFVVVPIVGPILLSMGFDPIWLGIMIALNLQTSFLTPPFGFALFYLRGVAPKTISTGTIYRGVIPFIMLQIVLLGILFYWPDLTTYLPKMIYNN